MKKPRPPLINLSDASSVAYWKKELTCTETQLYAAANIVGSQVEEVRKYLKNLK